MKNSTLKKASFIISVLLFIGFFAITHYYMGGKPWEYLDNCSNDDVFAWIMLFGPVVTVLGIYIAKTVDYYREKCEVKHSWAAGLGLAIISFYVLLFSNELLAENNVTNIDGVHVYLICNFIFCICGIFSSIKIKKNGGGSGGGWVEVSGPCDLTSSSGCV